MAIVSMPVDDKYHLPIVFVGSYAISYLLFKAVSRALTPGRKAPPCLWYMPVLGSIPFMPHPKYWYSYFLQKSQELGSVYGLYMGNRYAIVLNGRETLHEALVKHSRDFSGRADFYTSVSAMNPHSKGIIDHHYNPEFRRQHQLSLTILKEFGFGKDIMEERILEEVSSLIEQVRSIDGRPFWPDSAITSHVLNVIVSIQFGRRLEQGHLDDFISTIHGFVLAALEVFPINTVHVMRFLPHFHRVLKRMIGLNGRMFAVIDNGIETAEEDSFVRRYMEIEGNRLDSEQLRYIVRDLLLAGTETTASTLLWGLGVLAQPDGRRVQERMRAEIDARVPRDRLPSLAERPHLTYVEATILELMRIRTVVPLALIHETCADTTVNGFFIPAGTLVFPNLYSIHMDQDVWDNPEEFRPERFLNGTSGEIIGKDRIIPFSLGHRSCLGELLAQQEIFLFLTGIVQNFTIKPPDGVDSFPLRERISVTVAPEKYEVCLVPRLDFD